MIVILLAIMIIPAIPYGRTNMYDRINDYILSLDKWSEIANNIPYKIYIFENSGYGNVFNLNPKITYISEKVFKENNGLGKGLSVALVVQRFIDLLNLNDDDKIFFVNGRYGPINELELTELFDMIEKNEIVVSGMPPDYGGVNTRWTSATVNIYKEVIENCIDKCNDGVYIYESNFKDVIDKHKPAYYPKPIKIAPTYEGGTNAYREFLC